MAENGISGAERAAAGAAGKTTFFWVLVSCLTVLAGAAFSFRFDQPFKTPKILVLTLLVVLLGLRANGCRPLTPRMALLGLWPLLSGLWAVNPGAYIQSLGLFYLPFFAYMIAPGIDADGRLALRRGLLWAALAVALYDLALRTGVMAPSFQAGTVAGSFFGNPNFSAHFLFFALCFGRPRAKPWSYLWTGIIAAAILWSGCRAVWLATTFWFVLMVVTPKRALRGGLLLAAVLAVLGGVWLAFSADLRTGAFYMSHPRAYAAAFEKQPPLIADRDPWFAGKRLSLMTRIILQGNSAAMLGQRPLTGFGLGQFHSYYPKFSRSWVDDPNMSREYRAVSPHNLLLETALTLGWPWLSLFLSGLAAFYRKTASRRSYWVGFCLQLGMAMGSLNYLNPMILTFLALLAPPEGSGRSKTRSGFILFVVLGWLPMVVSGLWDYRVARAKEARDAAAVSPLFPEIRANLFYADGRFEAAWREQVRAFERDPYGPETLFNLALIAWELGKSDGPRPRWLAVLALRTNRRMFPFYRPAVYYLQYFEERLPESERIWVHQPMDDPYAILVAEIRGSGAAP